MKKACQKLRQAEGKAPHTKWLAKFWIQRKNSWRKLKVPFLETHKWKKAIQSYCFYGENVSGLDRSNQPQLSLTQTPDQEQGPHAIQFYVDQEI